MQIISAAHPIDIDKLPKHIQPRTPQTLKALRINLADRHPSGAHLRLLNPISIRDRKLKMLQSLCYLRRTLLTISNDRYPLSRHQPVKPVFIDPFFEFCLTERRYEIYLAPHRLICRKPLGRNSAHLKNRNPTHPGLRDLDFTGLTPLLLTVDIQRKAPLYSGPGNLLPEAPRSIHPGETRIYLRHAVSELF